MATNEGDEDHSDQTTLRESPQPAPSPSTTNSPKMSRLKKLWVKARLSPREMKNTLKLSLPAIIALASFQSDFIANYFTVNGYIFAMIAFVLLPTLPRARFLRTLFGCIFTICLAAALGLLALWCGTQARLHTTDPNAPPEPYNSSQAAILGIYLLFAIFLGSSFKSIYPTTTIPILLFEVYMCVVGSSGVDLVSMDAALEFTNKLLVNFMFGLAISTGVGLFIFPLSCRQVFFESVGSYLNASRNVMRAQQAYLQSIESQDPWHTENKDTNKALFTAHQGALNALYGSATKMRGEQGYAEREWAYGRLHTHEIPEISDLLLRIMPAFSGLGFVCDILNRLAAEPLEPSAAVDKEQLAGEWQTIMKAMHDPFAELSDAMEQAIEHVLINLQLKKRPQVDEAKQAPAPGSPDFLAWYNEQTMKFTKSRELVARLWFEKEGVVLPEGFLDPGAKANGEFQVDDKLSAAHRKPFTIIYIQYLMFAASRELLDLITWVDSKVADETLTKRRLIGPTFKHLQALIKRYWRHGRSTEASMSPNSKLESHNGVQRMSNPQKKVEKDPEHMAPAKWWEVVGNYVRLFPKFMRSTHATHGLRVACAVMSVAIGFYIRTSSTWFSRNRWLWAMFAIVLATNRTAGVSLFMYVCRIGGTAIAMCVSFAVYYMVDGIPAGVLVMLWVWFLIAGYIVIKFPFYMPAIMVAGFATIVMVGNELQDKKLGFARVSALGQAVHEEYLMAPNRLAIVAAGVGIAFFWTIFPYPISEHTELRQDLASTLYYLASYHSMVSKTVTGRAQGLEPHMASRNQNELAVARAKCFTKIQFLFGRLKQHLNFTKYQVVIGGRFPTAQYAELVTLCEKIATATAVIGYSSTSFVRAWELAHPTSPPSFSSSPNGPEKSDPQRRWIEDFRSLVGTVDIVSEEVTSTLVMLSNHMAAGTPFPPYTRKPEEGRLAKVIRDLNGDMLTVSHITEPGYAAFVTMTMAGRGINRALGRQIELCQELVGVLDFSSFADMEKQDGLAAEAAARDDLRI